MTEKIPTFKFRAKSPSVRHFGCIEMEQEVIHQIEDLSAFYKSLGYTSDMAKAGTLPDEFVWDTYFRNCTKDCNSCYQLHLVEYLLTSSYTFRKKFKYQIEMWLALLRDAKAVCTNTTCSARDIQHLQTPLGTPHAINEPNPAP